jgi:hypothetical protein
MGLLAGCATTTLSPGSTLNLAAPCVPPGISEEFFFWPVLAYRQLKLRTEDGQEVEGAWVVYGRAGRAVAVVWAGDLLLAVDPSPETEAPDWIDAGLVITDDDGFILRENPGLPCHWEKNAGGGRA